MLNRFLCTQSRDRTGTAFLPLVFETNASTNSAIWAYKMFLEERVCKCIRFFVIRKI